MPLTPDLRRAVDQIRDYMWAGGYPDPMQNAEQLSFLFYFYLAEGADAVRVRAARRPGADPYESAFSGEWTLRNPLNAQSQGQIAVPAERLRWSHWANALNGDRLVTWLRDEVFPFFADRAGNGPVNFLDGARLQLDEPTVLSQVVSKVNDLRLETLDADTKGDLFEHVLRQTKQAGELGQFRTPRNVIRAIVEMLDPVIGETVYDPAAGTAGFLIAAFDHIRLANSDQVEEVEVDGKTLRRGHGERLGREAARQLHEAAFYGNDVDARMVRLATMNLSLRGLDRTRILRRDALTRPLSRADKAELGLPAKGFDVVLANPPFSGKLDADRIVDEVRVGSTKATELLFLQYMLNQLKPGGRCGVIVPEGVLFGSTGAHKELRRRLMENNTVEAVLSLPGGVFNPYSGVKTSVLVFRKGGTTGRVMFLHADADGYKLDANHDQPIEADDLPGLVAAFESREELWEDWQDRDPAAEWT
ncbi:MAG: N-6 DNA methylase, partial [Pseudomonadota bacterium]